MKITIQTTANGLIVSQADDKWSTVVYETESHDDRIPCDVNRVQTFLYDLLDMLGYTGSRHDAARIRIKIEPGDKHGGEKTQEEE